MSTAPEIRAPRGRPRDPDVARRVQTAALDLFGEVGWTTSSIDEIAHRSGVSKRSIYLRWANKEELLRDALSEGLSVVGEIYSGDVRSDLIELARQVIDVYTGSTGAAALRLAFEASPDTATLREDIRQVQLRAARALVQRYQADGLVPPHVSPVVLLDVVCGAALNHVVTCPESQLPHIRSSAAKYAAQLIDFVMACILAGPKSKRPLVREERLSESVASAADFPHRG